MIGKTISHYKILEKLGEGGMGVVYKAEDTKLKRIVALKFLPPELTRDKEAKKRFVHEARAASALQHHNICTIHEVDETSDGRMFICMDFYEGETLKDKVAKGPLKIDEAIDFAIQIAEGLDKAHEQKLAHRDIKSANVIATTDGVVKIVDFGLAKLAGQTKLTKTGTTVGTLSYMSPEQARGEGVDHRTDIWSLGVVLYEMLAGQFPFRGDHEQAVTYQIVHEDAEPITAVRTGVPMALERIVNKCLEKDASNRYQHADELLVDLRNVKKAPVTKPKKNLFKYALPTSVVLLAVIFLVIFKPFQSQITPDQRTGLVKVAVLPFENLGAAEDEYFADGITDEIISRLSVIKGLAVISRTSSMKYKKSEKGLREIGQELGVAYILQGTIRWDKRGGSENVRITPQLINASDDVNLWASNYEREITQIFSVQAEIASQIAEALDITLLESERQTLENKPTADLDAYKAYLRGLDYTWGAVGTKETRQLGIQMFERAVELDPEFALSYAALSTVHSLMHHAGYDRTEERLSQAKAAVDQALELQPELPEAHLAFYYYYYWGHRDYERALEELAIAKKGLSNDSRILRATANIWRRQGKFKAAVERRKAAFALSPQDAVLARDIGETSQYLRRYADADRYYDLSISLAPDQRGAYELKAYNYITWLGDIKRAQDVLAKMPGESRDVQEGSLDLWRLEGNYQAILDFASSDSRPIVWWPTEVWTPALLAARAYQLMGEQELAHASYDSARAILEKELDAHPDDHRVHSALGIVYAGLGRKDEAISEGKRGVELFPVSKDVLDGPNQVWDLAEIYTMVGEYDAALDEIEYLLALSGWWSVQDLRLDPIWDPLREHPRYQALLEKYATD